VRILLVDDNAPFRWTMAALLEDVGHSVSEASSLTEARAALAGAVFELALLDVNLGDGLGTDLIDEVRRACPNVRVTMLSGGSADPSLRRADLVLEKGDDPEQILRKLALQIGEGR
jgi:DNA-binding response OmpR family regulator